MLVVDDELAVRELLAVFLRSEGYEVVTAGDGRQALALLDGNLPDVIVLDLLMPVMDGFTFRAKQLLSARLAHVPVVVLSATCEWDDVMHTLRPQACLDKPFDLDELLGVVAEVCATAD